MKKTILPALAAILPLCAFATEPNIYAYGLSGDNVGTTEYEFVYSLNTPATSVEIVIYNADGSVAGTIPSTGLSKGENKFTGQLPELEKGTYAWAVKATAEATEGGEYVTPVNQKTVIGAGSDLDWGRMRGMSVNINPETEAFGTVYGTSGAYTTTQQASYCGAVAWSPLLDAAGKVYKGDVAWPVQTSPNPSALNDAFVSLDGNLYISNWTDGTSGIWMMYGNDPTAPFLQVFDGTRASSGLLKNADGIEIAGSVASACTVGQGEGLVLYTYDEDCLGGGVMRYNIGSYHTSWAEAPSKVIGKTFEFDGTTVTLNAGAGARIRPDNKGGIWLAVNMAPKTYLLHFNADDALDYCDTTLPQSITGALAVSADGSLLAISSATSGASEFSFFDITYDENGKPSLSERTFADGSNKMTCYTNNVRNLAFDYADNLYAATQGSTKTAGLSMYVLPKTENSTTVKAITPLVLSVSTGIDNAIAETGLSYRGDIISSGNAATLYSASGTIVAQGKQIDTAVLAPGIYIAKADGKTIKIIR